MGHEKDRFQRGVRTSPGEEMTIGVDRSVVESRVAVSKSVGSAKYQNNQASQRQARLTPWGTLFPSIVQILLESSIARLLQANPYCQIRQSVEDPSIISVQFDQSRRFARTNGNLNSPRKSVDNRVGVRIVGVL